MSVLDPNALLNNYQWNAQIERLIASDDSNAVVQLEQLAAIDRNRLVRSLGEIVASESPPPPSRAKAAWLLKEVCSADSIPYLERAMVSSNPGPELRAQILDTLERLAFAGHFPSADLQSLADALTGTTEIRKFKALLSTIGNDTSQAILHTYARDPETRADLLTELVERPATWIDPFLARLAEEFPDDSRLRAAIEERSYRRLQERLRDPNEILQIDAETLTVLWSRHDVSLINRLAQRGRLDPGAVDRLLSIDGRDVLTRAQRKLLEKAKAAARLRKG